MDAFRAVLQVARLMSKRDRAKWLGTISISVISGLLEMISAWAVFITVAIIAEAGSAARLPWLEGWLSLAASLPLITVLALLASLFAVKTALALAAVYLGHRFLNQAQARFAGELYSAYLAAPFSLHLKHNAIEKAHTVIQRVTFAFKEVAHEALVLTNNFVVAIAILVVVFVSDWRAATISILFVVSILGLMSRLTKRALVRLGQRRDAAAHESLSTVMSGLRAIEEIKVLGRERRFAALFGGAQSRYLTASYRIETLLTMPRILSETIFVFVLLAIVAVVLDGEGAYRELVPLLGVYAYAGLRLMPIANRTAENIQRIRSATPTLDALSEQFRELGISGDALADLPAPVVMNREIALSGVSLVYRDKERPAVQDIDLTLRRGEWLGLVGDTGAGKTSILYLLLGLLTPTRGCVLVDGQDLHAGGGQRLVRAGYVPQQCYLLDDTVRRNIAFGYPDAEIDDDRIQAAIRVAQLDGFVRQLDHGLETVVGEDAIRMSGGERQRLALARALYARPGLLILDEATSALDANTETALLDAIRADDPDRTVVMVTHRVATVRRCDRLIYLRNGRIAAQGDFDTVLREDARFRALAERSMTSSGRQDSPRD